MTFLPYKILFYQSIYLSFTLSIYQSMYIVYLSIYLYIVSIYFHLIYLFFNLIIYLSNLSCNLPSPSPLPSLLIAVLSTILAINLPFLPTVNRFYLFTQSTLSKNTTEKINFRSQVVLTSIYSGWTCHVIFFFWFRITFLILEKN